MDPKYVCPCGLTCCDCLFYQGEIYEAARKLKEAIEKHDFAKFLIILSNQQAGKAIGEHLMLTSEQARDKMGRYFETFKGMPEFMNILDSIVQIQCKTTCREKGGCSVGGNTQTCEALHCIRAKGYEGCWQCDEFRVCGKLSFLKRNYGSVIEENLQTVNEKGAAAVESRGNQYYAWQRR